MTDDERQERTYQLDLQKFAFEKEKETRNQEFETKKIAAGREIEDKKLNLERLKAKWTTISVVVAGLSIVVSASISGFTVVESQRLQKEAADTQFALKAADLVLQSDDPEVNQNKKERFQQLFPDRVSSTWGRDFDWKKYAVENDDMKMEMAKLLTEHPTQAPQIIALYKALFKDDPTVQALLMRIPAPVPHK
jgi:hypothetical protein